MPAILLLQDGGGGSCAGNQFLSPVEIGQAVGASGGGEIAALGEGGEGKKED
ncbi:MAG: hypothetical protein ACKO1T_12425 [Sediminibacterium sp.]